MAADDIRRSSPPGCSNPRQSAAERHQVLCDGGSAELVKERNWLVRVTSTINQHWQKKNAARKHLPTTCFS